METTSQALRPHLGNMNMQSLAPLDRWADWEPHFTAPGDRALLEEMVKSAFDWLHPARVELIRHPEAVSLAHKTWIGLDRFIHDRYSRHLDGHLPDDGASLRCAISSLYRGAHAQCLWVSLVYAPALITLKCTLSESVRLLLFYGTCFKNLDQPEFQEIDSMLMFYESGFMPIGLSHDKTLFVVTG